MNLIKNIYVVSALLVISLRVNAFPCYLTLIKSSCWNDYNVQITMTDLSDEKVLINAHIPQDQLWVRQAFECSPKQTFKFQAQFDPAIWAQDKDKKYSGKRYWPMPSSTEHAVAWNMTLCYPDDFSATPMPPTAEKCGCDRTIVPPIPEKKSS